LFLEQFDGKTSKWHNNQLSQVALIEEIAHQSHKKQPVRKITYIPRFKNSFLKYTIVNNRADQNENVESCFI
jgi:hypothetical protein